MSLNHTPGRLTADEEDGYLLVESGHCIAAVGSWQSTQDAGVDARRLAACWNACMELPTERLEVEQLADTMAAMTCEIHEVRAKYDAAFALLTDILKADDDSTAELAAMGLPLQPVEITERIRAFLHPEVAG